MLLSRSLATDIQIAQMIEMNDTMNDMSSQAFTLLEYESSKSMLAYSLSSPKIAL